MYGPKTKFYFVLFVLHPAVFSEIFLQFLHSGLLPVGLESHMGYWESDLG